MIAKFVVIGVVVIFALNGCTIVPTRDQMQNASYGPPVSKAEFENTVRNGMEFFDPYSAMINCTVPRKGWGDYAFNLVYGWGAHCKYNAKNRMGGYVGETSQIFIISNGILLEMRPNTWKYLD
jgi:hypothetical protein